MHHSRLTAAVVAATLALCAGAHAAAVNLVQNGGFETLTNGDNQVVVNSDGSQQTTGSMVSSATGWYSTNTSTNGGYPFLFFATNAVTTGFGDAWDNGQRYLWGQANQGSTGVNTSNTWDGKSSTGTGHYLVMDGDYHATAISQSLAGLVIGTVYQLSFSWAAAQFNDGNGGYTGNTTESVQVSLGGQTQNTATYSLSSKGFSGWMTATMNFKYDGSSNVLSFLATGGPSGLPPMALLDNVALYAVPEPGSWAALGVGLLAVAGLTFRTVRKPRSAA